MQVVLAPMQDQVYVNEKELHIDCLIYTYIKTFLKEVKEGNEDLVEKIR